MRNDKGNVVDMKDVRDASKFAKEGYSPEDEFEYYYFSLRYSDDRAEYVKYSSPSMYVRDVFTKLAAYQISKEYGCPNVEPCSSAEFEAGAKGEIESSDISEKILDEDDFHAAPDGFQLAVRYLNSAYFSSDIKEMRLFLHKAMLQLRHALSPQGAEQSDVLPNNRKGA
ncbi:MAG: hypothetical protein LBS53_12335 [Synergistaceae bacterium]|nr:hypothetical protein [Synergistaceae bacterium]